VAVCGKKHSRVETPGFFQISDLTQRKHEVQLKAHLNLSTIPKSPSHQGPKEIRAKVETAQKEQYKFAELAVSH
jgi:hypothetical protein